MKKPVKILLITLSVVSVLVVVMFFAITDGLKEAVNVPVGSVDLSAVPDGEYYGSYDFKRWSASVRVTVRDHKITTIDLVDDVSASQITDCSEEMIRRVIAAQDTQVDAVSGATATSKAYLKAIEDALSD